MYSLYSLLQRRSLIGSNRAAGRGHHRIGRVPVGEPLYEQGRWGGRTDPHPHGTVCVREGDADQGEVVTIDPLQLAVRTARARRCRDGTVMDSTISSWFSTVRFTPVKKSLRSTSRRAPLGARSGRGHRGRGALAPCPRPGRRGRCCL